MQKETTYQEKIRIVEPWLEEIIDVVKKDLKNEHLKADKPFCKKYFLGKNPAQLSVKEMADAYRVDIAQGNVGLGEFIATRWLLRHTDIYAYFEEKIKGVSEDFEQLDQLPQELSDSLMLSSVKHFGAKKSYLFAIFNSVVFPPTTYSRLKELALQERESTEKEAAAEKIKETVETMQARHVREMTALTDRYEKKLLGMQKKYLNDVAGLKKQIAQLQKKLSCTNTTSPL